MSDFGGFLSKSNEIIVNSVASKKVPTETASLGTACMWWAHSVENISDRNVRLLGHKGQVLFPCDENSKLHTKWLILIEKSWLVNGIGREKHTKIRHLFLDDWIEHSREPFSLNIYKQWGKNRPFCIFFSILTAIMNRFDLKMVKVWNQKWSLWKKFLFLIINAAKFD